MKFTSAKLPACANCAYSFVPEHPDDYCPRCGQQNQDPTIRFRHLGRELVEGTLHLDSKILRSMRLLVCKPGELTRQFLAGHRAPYVTPLQLYGFINFLFFFLLSLGAAPSASTAQDPEKNTIGRANTLVYIAPGYSPSKVQLDSLPRHLSSAQADSVLRRHHVPATRQARLLLQHMPAVMRMKGEDLVQQIIRAVSLMLFGLMPLSALLLHAAYRGPGRYYANQLILAIHLHCMVFALLALNQVLSYVPGFGSSGVGLLLFLLIPLYLVLALRRLYGQGWALTLLKGAALATSYVLLLALGFGCVLGVELLLA